jgi:hypothetical protein
MGERVFARMDDAGLVVMTMPGEEADHDKPLRID